MGHAGDVIWIRFVVLIMKISYLVILSMISIIRQKIKRISCFTRKLIQDVQDFVAEYENCDLPLEQVRKTTYTPLERLEWQNNMKTEVLEKWLKKSRKLLDDKKLFEKNIRIH